MTSNKVDGNQRLPTNVYPTHYDVAIKTDLASSPPMFLGEAVISLTSETEASEITFNVDPSLKITHLAIAAGSSGLTNFDVAAITVDEEWQTATVDLAPIGGIKAGEAKLFVRWEAELGGNMNGYYKSIGTADENGHRPIYALTQFEPTAARRALPCWDEPSMKATFSISMIAREGEVVLSNMNSESSQPWDATEGASFSLDGERGATLAKPVSLTATSSEGKWVITKFATTPKMSTYLLAYACGPFKYLESKHTSALTGRTIPLRVYASNDIEQAQMGLDVMRWALPIYEELFEIEYPLPKLDTLVAHDFDMGAMENWGLITGRTTAYFCTERSSLAAKKRIGQVQCHEVAHMWFGNIVTMKWWDNLWLNEAFATLMGSIVLPDRIWPEWKMGTQFLNDHWVRALSLDGRRSSHPIEVNCANASEINQIFDAISYSKGASVLRMLRSVVGDQKFFKGVSYYLKKHLYGNAETKDLWAGISEAVGPELDVATIMANWTLKIGFPVVTVEEKDGEIKVTQNRFLSTNDVKPEEDETLWWIPLSIKTVKDGKVAVDNTAVLSDRSAVFKVDSDVFKLNAGTVGVYRVAYSPERLAKLGRQGPSFSVEDRVGIISDATALASAGYSKTSDALSLATELAKTETEYLPFSRIFTLLSGIRSVWWENDEIRSAIDKLRIELLRPVVNKMGYDHADGDSPETKQLRALAVSACSSSGDEEVIAELQKRFQRFLETGDYSGFPPELQGSLFAAAVRNGGEAEYNKIRELYDNPPNPSTKMDAAAALCATKQPELLDRTFAMLSDATVIKDQDLVRIQERLNVDDSLRYVFYTALSTNDACRRRTAEHFMDNWPALNERFSASLGLRNAINSVFPALSARADLDKVKAFVSGQGDSKAVKKYKNILAQSIEQLETRVARLERDEGDVKAWLRAHQTA